MSMKRSLSVSAGSPCAAPFTLDIAVPFFWLNTNKYKKCLLAVKFLSLNSIDFIDCVLCQ